MLSKNIVTILALTIMAVLALLTNQAYAGQVEAGLVSYYSFNDVQGDAVKDDWGPNDGILEGPTLPEVVQGRYGDGLRFAAQDSRVNCGNDESLNITEALSIEAWVYMEIPGSYPTVVGKSGSNWGYIFEFLTDTGQINLYLDGANPSWDNVAETAVVLGEWTHIVASYDGDTVRYYVNGEPSGDYPATGDPILSNEDNVHIGMRKIGEPYFFTGIIDEVRIYNRALDAAEATVNMNADATATISPK
ncbi:MAG: LamG domain-containing protein [Deltaproteobacteria bacterium]|nr:LamG domain-containing protein [Deltaproteobacteria bacterium]